MPRKVRKQEKPPLPFLERTLCGARVQNVPDVRAAINPKEFFTEDQEHNRSAQKSWISPQFDCSVVATSPVRRGRRKCHSATSILESCSQLSRKKSVCKFPSLTFQIKSGDQPHQPKTTDRKATECAVVSDAGNQPQGSGQTKRAKHSDTPKRQTTPIQERNVKNFSNGSTTFSHYLNQPETANIQVTEICAIPVAGASTPAPDKFSNVGPPPDVDTPKETHETISCPSSNSLHLLLPESSPSSSNQPPDILVPDTQERDYGLKVTWRRRMRLMLFLKERGHLSDSDVYS